MSGHAEVADGSLTHGDPAAKLTAVTRHGVRTQCKPIFPKPRIWDHQCHGTPRASRMLGVGRSIQARSMLPATELHEEFSRSQTPCRNEPGSFVSRPSLRRVTGA